MAKKFGKDDILAFLNAKFAKVESQPKKREQKEHEKRSNSEKPKVPMHIEENKKGNNP